MRHLLTGVIASLTLCLAACDGLETADGRPIIATVAPEAPPWPEPQTRYPLGSRLVRLDLDRPAAPPRGLTDDMVAAGGASVSFDGRRVAFVGRLAEDDSFTVWISDPQGAGRRRLAGSPDGAGAVAWLPDGRLAVAAPVDGPPVAAMSSAWALFVVSPDEGLAQRITFGAGELDPEVLADGRIVYSQWQPGGDGRPEGGSFSLFTVHPDGTGAAPLHGFHGGLPLKLRARQTVDGDLVFAEGSSGGVLTLRRVDLIRPLEEGEAVDLLGSLPLVIEPTIGGLPIAPEGSVFVHAVEAAARPRPQGHLSMVDRELRQGSLLCLDARPPEAREARRVRIAAGRGRGEEEILGEVTLAADGSFFATVPADEPLYLDLLAEDGRLLMSTETAIWVRPKEVRGCVGCHESPLTAPPNRRPLAVLEEPAIVMGQRKG